MTYEVSAVESAFEVKLPDGGRILKVSSSFPDLGGKQLVIGFPNGYAASIVQNSISYGNADGLWEIGFSAWDVDTLDWNLITFEHAERVLGAHDQVAGYLDPDDVSDWCNRLASLPHHKGMQNVT